MQNSSSDHWQAQLELHAFKGNRRGVGMDAQKRTVEIVHGGLPAPLDLALTRARAGSVDVWPGSATVAAVEIETTPMRTAAVREWLTGCHTVVVLAADTREQDWTGRGDRRAAVLGGGGGDAGSSGSGFGGPVAGGADGEEAAQPVKSPCRNGNTQTAPESSRRSEPFSTFDKILSSEHITCAPRLEETSASAYMAVLSPYYPAGSGPYRAGRSFGDPPVKGENARVEMPHDSGWDVLVALFTRVLEFWRS